MRSRMRAAALESAGLGSWRGGGLAIPNHGIERGEEVVSGPELTGDGGGRQGDREATLLQMGNGGGGLFEEGIANVGNPAGNVLPVDRINLGRCFGWVLIKRNCVVRSVLVGMI